MYWKVPTIEPFCVSGDDAEVSVARFMVGVEGVKGPTACEGTTTCGFAKSEVHQLGAGFGQHDVRRFQVAMDNALLMRLLQSLRDFGANLKNLIKRQRVLCQAIGERLAFEIFHDQEVGAVLGADVVQRADIRVLQRRNGPRFALHALFQFGIGGEMGGKNLDGDGRDRGECPWRDTPRPCRPHPAGIEFHRDQASCQRLGPSERNYIGYDHPPLPDSLRPSGR